MHPMLNTAVKAARKAGAIINRASLDLDLLKVSTKGPGDFVTEADRVAEATIIEVLKTAYPAHAILAEESGSTPGKQPDGEFTWIVDPIDGTTNFIHGLPHYCVSIALMHKGVITQACVYDPTNNELFTASRGAGAFLNDRRIRVSRRIRLDDALLSTGYPRNGNMKFVEATVNLGLRSAGLRGIGSSVLSLCYVASGRLDGFVGLGLKPWDIAAGSLIVTEAGGLMGDFKGDANYLNTGRVVAGTPKVFAALLPLLEGVEPDAPAASTMQRAEGTAPAKE